MRPQDLPPQELVARASALTAAASHYAGTGTTDNVLHEANRFYEWLVRETAEVRDPEVRSWAGTFEPGKAYKRNDVVYTSAGRSGIAYRFLRDFPTDTTTRIEDLVGFVEALLPSEYSKGL